MDDEVTTDTESLDRAANWTIKKVRLETRLRAAKAARMKGQPIGAWLDWAVEAAAAAQERNALVVVPQAPARPARELVPTAPAGQVAADASAAIGVLVEAACRLAAARRLPKALRDTANLALAQRLAGYQDSSGAAD